MSLPPNMKHKKSSPPNDEPSFSLDFTPDVMQPIPNVDFIPGVTSADPPAKKKDDYTIMTQTPYVFHYDVDNNVAMLTKPLEDKILDQVNIRVFDQIQKVVDEVNSGYDYVKKTKILMAQLDYYKELRKYEDVIRKATNLTVESDPFSLEKLQQRICSDSWLGIFFKKVNETRTSGKKLTKSDWITVKKLIISYYFNYFLQKKTGYAIKQDKLPYFQTSCIRLRPDNCKFQDFYVYDFSDTTAKSTMDIEIKNNQFDYMFLTDNFITKESTFRDDFRKSEYTDIMDLINAVDRVFHEDTEASTIINNLKTWYGITATKARDFISQIFNETSLSTSGTLGGTLGGAYAGYSITSLLTSLVAGGAGGIGLAPVALGGAIGLISGYVASQVLYRTGKFLSIWNDDDGAMIHPATIKPLVATDKVSIGKIRKIGDKYIQSGFYNTLCIFVDETLDKCKDAFEAKYGAIEWGKPKTDDVPFNFSDLVNGQQQRKELSQLATLVTDANALKTIKASIYDFPKVKSYDTIRGEIDTALVTQLKAFIADPTSSLETAMSFKDENEFNTKFDTFKKEYNAVFDDSKRTDWQKVFNGIKKPAWTSGTSGKKTFADGGSTQSQITTPGHFHHRSPRKSDGGKPEAFYKKSPDYKTLKKSYKNGEISKEKFKQGKHALKRSLKR